MIEIKRIHSLSRRKSNEKNFIWNCGRRNHDIRHIRRPLPPAANAQGFNLSESSQTITFSPLQLQNETSAQQTQTAATSQIDSYYQSASGKSGPALKKALHDIIDDHTQLSYSQVWDALKKTDEDPNNPNNVLLLYSGVSRSKQSNGGNVGQWNREHVWAKSHGNFGTSQGPGTDLHHLRAADVQTNSTRGNLDFDMGGNEYKGAPGNFYDSDSFEPHSRVKGDVARMLFIWRFATKVMTAFQI